MKSLAITCRANRRVYWRREATLLLAVFLGINCLSTQASPQPQAGDANSEANCKGLFVIQGRIMRIEGTIVKVKTPDSKPAGARSMFIVAGPIFRADISKARVVLPDGKKSDNQPLAANEHVLMLLSGPDLPPLGPGHPDSDYHIYSALTVEHLAPADMMTPVVAPGTPSQN